MNKDLKILIKKLKSNDSEIIWSSSVRRFYYLKDKANFELCYGIGRIGDIVIAKLIKPEIAEIELPDGRIGVCYKNQFIVGALGYRESTISYVGKIPKKGIIINFKNRRKLSLLSKSGLMGDLIFKSAYYQSPPKLESISLFRYMNDVLNLKNFAISSLNDLKNLAPLIIIVGSSSECGKSTIASHLIRGLVNQNFKVAAAKLTGAGSIRDKLKFIDSGAFPVYDFVDSGLVSTPDSSSILTHVRFVLNKIMEESEPDLIIIELAGSILVEANKAILSNKEIIKKLKGIIFVANDEIGAIGGIFILRNKYNITPLCVSGKATDTIAGVKYITKETGIPAINWRNVDQIVKIIKNKLKN